MNICRFPEDIYWAFKLEIWDFYSQYFQKTVFYESLYDIVNIKQSYDC